MFLKLSAARHLTIFLMHLRSPFYPQSGFYE